MGAIPIIATAVSIAGTASSIAAQNRQVNQQNAAIGAQISANEQSEEIRKIRNQAQRTIMRDQFRLDNQRRQTEFIAARDQLRQLRMQAEAGTNQQVGQANLQARQQQSAVSAQSQQNRAALQGTQSAMQEQQADVLNQVSSALKQAAGVSESDMRQAQAGLSSTAAQMRAMSGSRGKTAQLAGQFSPSQIERVLQEVSKSADISGEALNQIIQSQEFGDIINEIAAAQAVANERELQAGSRQVEQNRDFSVRGLELANRGLQGQVTSGLRMQRLDRRIGNNQARINRQFAEANLITGSALEGLQSAAQNAQLRSQQQSGVGFISSLAQLAQSASPIAGLFTNPTLPQPQQQQQGLAISLNQPLYSNTVNLSPSYQDVPRNIPYYG